MDHPRVLQCRLTLLAALVVLACLMSLALTARAEAFVYWTNPGSDSIGRADLDGAAPDQDFIRGVPEPLAVAVDDTYIYWSSADTLAISRARLDGTGVDPDFITGVGTVYGIAVDKDHIYWATYAPGTIGRAGLDGSDVRRTFIDARRTWVRGIAVASSHIYWSFVEDDGAGQWFGGIDRAKKDGSEVTTDGWLWFDQTNDEYPGSLWAGDTYLWWTGPRLGIGRIDIPGGLHVWDGWGTGGTGEWGLSKQGEWVYWADDGIDSGADQYAGSISAIRADKLASRPAMVTAVAHPKGVATDGGQLATISGVSVRAAQRGAIVTITGRHFGTRRGAGTVRFGRAVVGRYLRWSDHRIVVAVPKTAPLGRVKLAVRTKYGASEARSFSVRP